jgi:1-acyl-sn-glycerol-3-phosphate acyltransferase
MRHLPLPSSSRPEVVGLRRLVETALGMLPSTQVDPLGKDPTRWEEVRPFFEWLYDRWFRVQLLGGEHLDGEGPTLLVANRGGYLPWDAAMLMVAAQRHGLELRPLLEDETFYLPYVGTAASRLGAARACRDNAAWILRRGGAALVFPEGAQGSRKPFSDRYRLRPFAGGGFVRIAKETGARLLPVAVVGSEEATPLLGRLPLRALGLPALPITPTFPWLGLAGLFPLPTSWTIEVGEPVAWEPGELDDAAAAAEAEALRGRLDAMLRRLRRVGSFSVGPRRGSAAGAPPGWRGGPRSPAAPGSPG